MSFSRHRGVLGEGAESHKTLEAVVENAVPVIKIETETNNNKNQNQLIMLDKDYILIQLFIYK